MIRKVTQSCITCFKARPQPIVQRMAPLPSHRVQQFRPFVNTGVDFAGPFSIRASKLRKAPILKAYIAIYICMSTKAIHLELVNDMTSVGFLGSLKRFMARRGKCSNIYSDNGRNFVAANRELTEFFEWLSGADVQDRISSDLLRNNIVWHFNPPYPPHRGGIWEAGVKSVKYHLRRTVGVNILTYEEFSTFLCEIEAVLNSRPLTPLSSDASDLKALTPGDFLIGHDLTTPMKPGLISIPFANKARWELLSKMKKSFWDRWQKEYLPTLQQVTNKWRGKPIQINVGDLVIVQLDNQPVSQWPLGRIIQLHPSSDDVTRTVDVRLADKTVTRAVQRLCLLPYDETT